MLDLTLAFVGFYQLCELYKFFKYNEQARKSIAYAIRQCKVIKLPNYYLSKRRMMNIFNGYNKCLFSIEHVSHTQLKDYRGVHIQKLRLMNPMLRIEKFDNVLLEELIVWGLNGTNKINDILCKSVNLRSLTFSRCEHKIHKELLKLKKKSGIVTAFFFCFTFQPYTKKKYRYKIYLNS